MQIIFCQDATIDLNLRLLEEGLNNLSGGLSFVSNSETAIIPDKIINFPKTYRKLKLNYKVSTNKISRTLIATTKRYDNNYFHDYEGNIGIISFVDWDRLTTLPLINGLVYFTCHLLSDYLNIGKNHHKTTGCLNDFLWAKTDIDVGMRSAFLCPNCQNGFKNRQRTKEENEIFNTLLAMLDNLCLSSRAGMSVIEYWGNKTNESEKQFDAFICYNRKDIDSVRDLKNRLKKNNVRTWFDEDNLKPGDPFQDILEAQIESIKCAIIAVGKSGTGPWQDFEIRAFIAEFLRRGCPVIPVLLSDCNTIPPFPLFLKQYTWVDMRKNNPDPFKLLLWGITDERQ